MLEGLCIVNDTAVDRFEMLVGVLAPALGRRVERRAALAPRVGYRVGGPAAVLAACRSEAEVALCGAAAAKAGVPLFVLGRGTNLLVRDGGVQALVVTLEGELEKFERIETLPDGTARVRVGGGMATGALVQKLLKEELSGAEFLALIPGSMGGALRMNAGAHGGEMAEILESARVVGRGGKIEERAVLDLGLSYRRSSLAPEEIVTGMILRLAPGDKKKSRAIVQEHAEFRRRTQPSGEPNAGSVFKNPPGDFAGRLLEQAGMKGVRVGGARVSEKHANWIVTEPGAAARDVEDLAAAMRKAVREKFGVTLELEIAIVGESR